MATDVFFNFSQAGGVCVILVYRDARKIQRGAKLSVIQYMKVLAHYLLV